jgi:glyoxylase-like metal-dependent hydrolase (beta-lactamase superfamily II)
MSTTDILTIDHQHLGRPNVIATYVLLGDKPALVDPGPASTLPVLEAGMAEHGLSLSDVHYILLTHIHLDHAGATGTILQRNPHIHVYVHERGAPHMINPERLMNSAIRLYGDRMDELWGMMVPIAADAVTTLKGGEIVAIGSRSVRVYDAPGHAKHHVIYLDEPSGTAFVGDNAGIRRPGHSYVRPATPPPDIDLEQWYGTLDLLEQLAPTALGLTHFGLHNDVSAHISQYRERLHTWGEIVRKGLASDKSESEQIADLRAYADAEVGESQEQRDLYQRGSSAELGWYGLARYWQKKGTGD